MRIFHARDMHPHKHIPTNTYTRKHTYLDEGRRNSKELFELSHLQLLWHCVGVFRVYLAAHTDLRLTRLKSIYIPVRLMMTQTLADPGGFCMMCRLAELNGSLMLPIKVMDDTHTLLEASNASWNQHAAAVINTNGQQDYSQTVEATCTTRALAVARIGALRWPSERR